MQELTQEVERLKKDLYVYQKVIEDIYGDANTVLEETGAKLHQLAQNFEQSPVRTITVHLGVTKTMRRNESDSTLPVSTDESRSDHRKEPDSDLPENSDTGTLTAGSMYLDEMLHPLKENTDTKSPHQQLEGLIQTELMHHPTSSNTSSEVRDYSSLLEPVNQTWTQSTDSLGFTHPTEATKSSSEYESDGDQVTLRPKTQKNEILATPKETGFFSRKNWPLQRKKTNPKDEPTTKDGLIAKESPSKKEPAADLTITRNVGTDEVVYEEPETQQDKTQPKSPDTATTSRTDIKKTVQLERFKIVWILALILGVLALVLFWILSISKVQTQDNKSRPMIWAGYERFKQGTNNTLTRLQECHAETLNEPASSCSDLCQESPSREYWIQANGNSRKVLVYCDFSLRKCSCDHIEGGWMRVANLDMTDPNQQCPDGFKLVTRTSPPLRTCGRPDFHSEGCVNTTFPVHGVQYSCVCGRIVGYQYGLQIAFRMYSLGQSSIDSYYLEGISLTHGQSPRQHIWSFVGSAGEEDSATSYLCPCTRTALTGIAVPPFVGNDYFCDTAVRDNTFKRGWYPDDPLWDGQGCGSNSTCCEFNNPPWFCKQLPQPTADDIELRICNNNAGYNDDTPFETVEIYVN